MDARFTEGTQKECIDYTIFSRFRVHAMVPSFGYQQFDVKTALLMHYMDVHSRHFGAVKHVLVITYKVQWQVLCLETSSQ